eukprot:6926537-Pyramimonas_sp.AAC.1
MKRSKNPDSKRSRRAAAASQKKGEGSHETPAQQRQPRKNISFKSPPTLEYLCPDGLEEEDFGGSDGGGGEEDAVESQESPEQPEAAGFDHILHQLSAAQLDQLWHGRQLGSHATNNLQPPEYIGQSLSFQLDRKASLTVGEEYARWVSRME